MRQAVSADPARSHPPERAPAARSDDEQVIVGVRDANQLPEKAPLSAPERTIAARTGIVVSATQQLL